ncbi:uncharacterized protein J7T54_007885 [Emericellopsis cladophorae]|uniref:Uncharacterized protein n=1 Tax=Emericellopsis cladophorae TaxID=2686198 RepID=A0A9Q0BGR8_9HYPO|nr:uncharacterized protein J7T54_007885 [Emericellopsis cladophorae]KAI6784792.1 hypothetical protein J7T54_007885 [Emericellopsis cladophorae]
MVIPQSYPVSDEDQDDEAEFSASSVNYDTDRDSLASEEHDGYNESMSLLPSLYEHSYAHGRRYHRYRHGRYPIPNDEDEQSREEMLHAMMLEATDGRLFYSPLDERSVKKLVNLGTGTGMWPIERTDLSPIQPYWVPVNVKFYVDDVEAEWMNGDDFDFVHLRNMIAVLRAPVDVLRQAYEHLSPGGWIELQDVNGQVHTDDDAGLEDWFLSRFTQHKVDAYAQFGTNAHAAVLGGDQLREADFVNIRHNYIKLPYGTWPKDKVMLIVGMYYRTACAKFFSALGAIHFPLLGWRKAEMEVSCAECRQGMRDPNVHAYGKMHFRSGQKPA